MRGQRDYYAVLGVSKDADDAAIKKAYRKLAKKYHPDTHPDDKSSEEKFRQVNQAYDILSDKEKRKMYDKFGPQAFDENGNLREASFAGGPFGGTYGGDPNYTYREFHFGGDSSDGGWGDIFGDLFGGGFGSAFSGANSGGRRGRRTSDRPQKGGDVTADITISFDEAVFGCEKTIHFQDESGGRQTLSVHIPMGIDTGKKIRLKGKGSPGIRGGQPGDLFLKVTVTPREGYERKGDDVYSSVQIPFTTAVFGGEAVVPTLYGDVKCKIREGAQSGSKLRLRGRGIPKMNRPDVRGDAYVTIQIQVPTRLSEEAKKKLREYERELVRV